MNRLKLWLYMLVVLGAGAANIYLITLEGAARGLAGVDAALESAATAHRARERLMASQAAAVAGVAVRDPALLEALAGPAPAPRKKAKADAVQEEPAPDVAARTAEAEAAARGAVERAARALALDLPGPAFSAVATPEWLARDPAADEGPQKEAAAFLRAAAGGTPRRGYARVNDALWYGVAMPAGEGAALALFLPVDAAWAAALGAEAGCEVTLDAGTPQLVTTARPEQARQVLVAARATPGRPVGQGTLGKLQLESPLRIQAPLLFARPPALRAQAVELTGLPKAYVVLSLPTAKAFSALAHYQWVAVEVLAGLLLIGLLLGVLVKTEVLPQVPAELVAVAARIERGEFAARAPTFVGALGTIAGALNKAAEAAQVAQAPAPHVDPFAAPPPVEPPEPQFDFSRPLPAAPASPPAPLGSLGAAPPAGLAAELEETTARLDGPKAQPPPRPAARAPGGAPDSAFPPESFTTRPIGRPAAPPAAPGGTAMGMPAVTTPGLTAVGMPAVTAPAVAGGPEEDEDTHWRAVHAEFIEVRVRCGESVDNLGFDRFRPKLEKNREALLQKYGCRTVRFQVYVKDGKAALKATPVK
ncbi:MAG: hypothetical protein IPO09_11890 [Anaeromyxobacter sp.]|nr:hypothetical protein [Anaeromyxobacter sp.]MBL0276291.1 hypothetical protein [Anaeromyxobacter sp.]